MLRICVCGSRALGRIAWLCWLLGWVALLFTVLSCCFYFIFLCAWFYCIVSCLVDECLCVLWAGCSKFQQLSSSSGNKVLNLESISEMGQMHCVFRGCVCLLARVWMHVCVCVYLKLFWWMQLTPHCANSVRLFIVVLFVLSNARQGHLAGAESQKPSPHLHLIFTLRYALLCKQQCGQTKGYFQCWAPAALHSQSKTKGFTEYIKNPSDSHRSLLVQST